VAILRSSSTQMLRLHAHGSTTHAKFQSAGQSVGLGPHCCVEEFKVGHVTPGQAADPLKGRRHWLRGITAPPVPSSFKVQLLQPSMVQLVTLAVPLQAMCLQMEVPAGEHTCGPIPSLQHPPVAPLPCVPTPFPLSPLPVPFEPPLHGMRNPGGSCAGDLVIGRQLQGS